MTIFSPIRRKAWTILLTITSLTYLSVVICTVGRMCFDHSDVTLDASDTALTGEVVHAFDRNRDPLDRAANPTRMSILSSVVRRPVNASQFSAGPTFSQESHQRESFLFQPWIALPVSPPRKRGEPLLNCSTISRMKIRSKIGHGVAKETFVAELDGVRVAIKMVTRRIHLVRICLDKLRKKYKLGRVDAPADPRPGNEELRRRAEENDDEEVRKEAKDCYVKPTAKLMKEVMLSLQLQHRNLVSLLGFCVRGEESESTDLAEHGVVSVYQLGHRFLMDNLQILPWQSKLRHAIELAEFLDYLDHSPLGSLAVPDLTEGNLVMAQDSIKLVDLDDLNAQEPGCAVRNGLEPSCPLETPCTRALCEGHNARSNLRLMNKLVFKRLLFPLSFPESVLTQLGQLNARLDSLLLTAGELRSELVDIKRSLKGYDAF